MNPTNKPRQAVAAAGISLLLLLALQSNAIAQFNEQFNSPTLDPAWQVVEYTGPFPRAHGFTSPANHFSLTDNPGHLRYHLDPMTHGDGYLNDHQTTFGFHSCCNHDPGLELHRTFGGENWLFETKASYFMPFTNGRSLDIRIYFGDGSTNTLSVLFQWFRDVNQNRLGIFLKEKTGPTDFFFGGTTLEGEIESFDLLGPSSATFYFRLERANSTLAAMWSDNGTTWNTAFIRNMGTQLNGLEQRVVVTGLSWFNTGGSYADWDYIAVTPTMLTVDIDIKPGSYPNSINPKNKSVIPVAILTTESFDVTTVDPLSVKFGPSSATESHGKGHIEDADGDGDMDLVLHFKTQDTGIQCGDTEASLTGQTFGGQTITGTDAIQTVGCGTGKAMAEAEAGIPAGYALLQNYPNPFNPETEMRFQLPEAGYVVVKIFNINGEEIRTLVEAEHEAGYHRVRWNGKDKNGDPVASGIYLYQLRAGNFSQVRKMSLLR
jgi:hypothetical protein